MSRYLGQSRVKTQKYETNLSKFLAAPGLLLVLAASSVLLVLNDLNRTFSLEWLARHSSLTGLLVQIISHLLGLIYVYALCESRQLRCLWRDKDTIANSPLSFWVKIATTINLSTRAFFEQNPLPLDRLKLFAALSNQKFDGTLPWGSLLIIVAFLAVTLFPSALWAGAITPAEADKNMTVAMALPGYQNSSWMDGGHVPPAQDEASGIFSFIPEWDIQGLILNSASGASSRTGGNVTHPKLDRTQYNYINRSYGVGSSVGLTDKQFASNTLKYTFFESGFDTNISCIYNQSSAWGLTPSAGQPSGWNLAVYEAEGVLPNTRSDFQWDYVAASIGKNPAIVALVSDTNNEQNYIAFTTNAEQYSALNNSQCQVFFTQRNFQVDVDPLARTIIVSPLEEIIWMPNKTLADSYIAKTVMMLYGLSNTLSTSLYVNPLGNVLMNNIDNVQAVYGNSTTTTLAGIEAVLTSIMDDTRVAYGSAQAMLLNDTVSVSVAVTYSAYSIGTRPYIMAILVFTGVTALVYTIEALRTRGWSHLSKLNFLDVKGIIVAASRGGRAVADEARTLHQSRGSMWVADPSDLLAGGIHVKLGRSEGDQGLSIVLTKPMPRHGAYTTLVDMHSSSEGNIPLAEIDEEQPLGEEVEAGHVL